MTDEEILNLANKTREENYCNKYDCKYGVCPLVQEGDGREFCIEDEYSLAFLDGFKASEKINEEREWPSDADLRKISEAYSVYEIACKESEKELLSVADRNLTIQQKVAWLSEVLDRFFINGYNYAKYEEKH